MGAGTSLSSLRAQKTTVTTAMANTREKISVAEEKIKRLQKASNSLDSDLDSLKPDKRKVEQYEVNDSKWKGQKEDKFEKKYHAYESSVKGFASKAKTAKDQIDDDLEKAIQEKETYITGLNGLETTMSRLDNQITVAKED